MTLKSESALYVAYYRVSTLGQKESGLGLEAQQTAVAGYLATVPGAECIREFTETESGKRRDRPKLTEALRLCRREKATLIIAKLDRLARNVHFISGLMESRVEFIACDNPHANRLMVHMLAAFAEHEREMISQRTREGLRAAKARGVSLGVNGKTLATQNRRRADEYALAVLDDVRSIPGDLRSTVADLTRELNRRRIETAMGGRWHRQSVYRLLNRYVDLGLEI